MDITSSRLELGKEPGVDMKEGVYTLPVLHALRTSSRREELTRILTGGVDDAHIDRALEIVADGDSIEHARAAVSDEVARAVALVERLPSGPAQHALVQLARFLSARCGAGETGGNAASDGASGGQGDPARIRAREDFHKRA
jgi:heptaprenyl diphosphate synthase